MRLSIQAHPEESPGPARFRTLEASPTLGGMTIRDRLHRWLSPSLFALIALCFLLPFATVSCDNASTTFTGAQLVTHTVPPGGVINEAPDCSTDISVCVEREAAPTATIALAAALIGLLFGLLGVVRGPGWCAAVGFGALLVLPFEGPFLGPDVTMHGGWDLALSLSGFAACVYMRRAWRRRRPQRRPHGALQVHTRALVGYLLLAAACAAVTSASDPTVQAIGAAATAWLLFLVVPAWLLVAAMLIRWQRRGYPHLVQRTARWDSLLWLGPLLALGLCSGTVRAFLLPPSTPIAASANDHVATA
jgi:hypothetical protein